MTFHASYRPTLPLANDKTGTQIQAQESGCSEGLGAAGYLGQVHRRKQGPGRPRQGASRWSLELPAPLHSPRPAPVSAIPVLASSTTPHQTAGSSSHAPGLLQPVSHLLQPRRPSLCLHPCPGPRDHVLGHHDLEEGLIIACGPQGWKHGRGPLCDPGAWPTAGAQRGSGEAHRAAAALQGVSASVPLSSRWDTGAPPPRLPSRFMPMARHFW